MEIIKGPKMTRRRKKLYNYYIGIDVSRDKLDLAIMKDNLLLFHTEIENSPPGIIRFITELKSTTGFSISKAVFAMEDTGFYCNHLLDVLFKLKASITVDNPTQIKRSLGLARGKNDKVDAIRIAQYVWRNREELKLWEPRREIINELAALHRLRRRLKTVLGTLRTPLKEQGLFINKKIQRRSLSICEGTLKSIEKNIESVELAIRQLIDSDPNLRQLNRLITSVPRIGPVTACLMIICTNEFKRIPTAKKFACYAGVAPFQSSSGKTTKKTKVSHIANKEIKALLHICAIGAISIDGELKAYYHRKKEEGKPGMLVLNAIRNKLIARIYACVREKRPFQKRLNLAVPESGETEDIQEEMVQS